jgi:hypothetical protein
MDNINYKQQLKFLKNKSSFTRKSIIVIDTEEDDGNILNVAFDASVNQFKMLDIIDLELDKITKNIYL